MTKTNQKNVGAKSSTGNLLGTSIYIGVSLLLVITLVSVQ